MMVGRLLSFWEAIFSGAMFDFREGNLYILPTDTGRGLNPSQFVSILGSTNLDPQNPQWCLIKEKTSNMFVGLIYLYMGKSTARKLTWWWITMLGLNNITSPLTNPKCVKSLLNCYLSWNVSLSVALFKCDMPTWWHFHRRTGKKDQHGPTIYWNKYTILDSNITCKLKNT